MNHFFGLFCRPIILAALCLAPSVSWGQTPQPPLPPAENAAAVTMLGANEAIKRHLEDALLVYRRGNLDGALSVLRAARAEHPALPLAEVILARFCLADRKTGEGRELLQRAITTQAGDPEAYLILGELALGESKLAEADGLFERALQKSDQLAEGYPRRTQLMTAALAGLATVAEQRGQWAAAEGHLGRWSQLDPDQPQVLGRLARIQFRQERVDEARQTFDRVAELDPTALPTPIQIGLLLENAGQRSLAEKEFAEAQTRYPNHPEARLAVAQWALYAGLLPLAQQNLDAARNAAEMSQRVRLLEAILSRFAGDPKQAETLLREVHSASPMNFEAINHLALALVDQQDESLHGQAIEYARLNATLHPDARSELGRNALATLAWALFRAGDHATARRVIDQVVGSGQFPPHAAYYAAEIYWANGAKDAAVKLAEAAVKSPRSFPEQDAAKQLLDRPR